MVRKRGLEKFFGSRCPFFSRVRVNSSTSSPAACDSTLALRSVCPASATWANVSRECQRVDNVEFLLD